MSTGSGQRRRAPAAALAPGFRFHPTDEELVGYYLKRKITGKTFRVDAISDVDLYKSEPWDLPGKSRIQSRDMEWYFFSALDKKYANRSRTNRATGSGYWKTTGKDRAVLCGGRHAGMKKTLVFHIGRAPKGERTNWVMHEYRLEDEDLSNSKIPQDAFVVCRVFQKKGPGPQNGAQYGAPLVEEEWEREDEETVIEQDDGDVSFNVINDDPLLADVDEFDKDWSAQDQAALPDFNTLIEIGDIPDDIDNDVKDLSQDLSILNDEFLELNDFVSSLVDPSTTHLDEALATLPNRNMFNPVEEESPGFSEFLLLDQSPDRSNFLEVNDILGSEPAQQIPSTLEVNADEDSTFFDASNIHFLDSLASSSSSPDLVDELIAYFDATENVDFESVSVDSNALRVNHVDLQPRREPQKNPETSQPRIMGFVDKLDTSISKGGFSGRLVSMLGSISSPPALAAEKNPNTNPIRIAPAMIQRDVDFFLLYTGGVDSEKIPKIEGGFLAFVQRNSFHLLFLSVLLLAASFKICVCVYSH